MRNGEGLITRTTSGTQFDNRDDQLILFSSFCSIFTRQIEISRHTQQEGNMVFTLELFKNKNFDVWI